MGHFSDIRENVCEDEEEDFNRQAVKIKISPEESFISPFLKLPGCVPINVHASFKNYIHVLKYKREVHSSFMSNADKAYAGLL
ncbi:hypothetical protein Glove_174g59 [Diversispora epigaea]|uniref:Uncharacterized protein n=1 Tax=Diversispora epigaea TaxID=1348612 RepID=A0A397IRM1_9GLOM|nr:hypothetical protein Glove_174g59 [Diversispora epigaea]